jgi:hypothetical protein
MSETTLLPTDAPFLLAGLIAARRCGDKRLACYFAGELRERHGIMVRFAAELSREERPEHGPEQTR